MEIASIFSIPWCMIYWRVNQIMRIGVGGLETTQSPNEGSDKVVVVVVVVVVFLLVVQVNTTILHGTSLQRMLHPSYVYWGEIMHMMRCYTSVDDIAVTLLCHANQRHRHHHHHPY